MELKIQKELEEINIKFEYDTEIIEDYINDKENKIEELEDDIDDLKGEISDLEEKISDMSNSFQYPEGFHNNIVTVSTLEKLFENLDRIPMDELEYFINQYAI